MVVTKLSRYRMKCGLNQSVAAPYLQVGTRNDGVRKEQPLRFVCVLTRAGWSNVEGLLEPFSESDCFGFQWLTTDGGTQLLISANGQW
jgi:hypothetical protein